MLSKCHGLGPDQAQHCVEPGWDPLCVQKLSADDLEVKSYNNLH